MDSDQQVVNRELSLRQQHGPNRDIFHRRCGEVSQRDVRVPALQGYLAHKKTPSPLGPPQDPTAGSYGVADSH